MNQQKGVPLTMSKWKKGIVGLAAIGAAAAGILYMKNKKENEDLEDEFGDDFEDLDFDLDDDLGDTSGREYVPLNNASHSESAKGEAVEQKPEEKTEETEKKTAASDEE